MPDFNNGKIYKLWSPQGDDIYIGSTTQSLSVRKAEHKRNYNNGKGITSKILFQKYDDVRIELVEKFACENRMELNKREGHYIRTLDCVNKVIPDRTSKEWHEEYYEKNKDYIKQYSKEYRENNKEKIKEYNRQYREANRDEINQKLREYNKEWYENNKDEIKEQSKKYRENNKEKIKERNQKYVENNRDEINQKKRERRAKKKNLVSVQSPVLSPEHSVE
jgi:hypothetical protein